MGNSHMRLFDKAVVGPGKDYDRMVLRVLLQRLKHLPAQRLHLPLTFSLPLQGLIKSLSGRPAVDPHLNCRFHQRLPGVVQVAGQIHQWC